MSRARTIRVVAVLIALSIASIAAPRRAAAQMDDPAWKADFSQAVWLLRMPSGTLLVGTKASLDAVDPATGRTLWSRTDLGGLAKESVDPTHRDVALLNIPARGSPTFRAIDVKDGRDRWTIAAVSLGHWFVPNRPALLVWLWRQGDRMTDKEFGGRMTMLGLDDGRVLWEDAAFFSSWPADRDATGNLWRVQQPVFDSDSTMITFMSPMGVRRWHLSTGRKLWEAELKLMGASSPYYGYAPVMVNPATQSVLVPTGLGLASVSIATGAVGSRTKLEGIPRQIELVSGGMLLRGGSETVGRYRRAASTAAQRFIAAANATGDKPIQLHGSNFLMLYDPATGAERWSKEVKLGAMATNFVVRGDKAYVWDADRILVITIATGESQLLARLPGFKHRDEPSELVKTETGLLLRGQTNVQFVDYDGKLVHHTSFQRPGRSVFVRAASATMRAGLDIAASKDNDVLGAMARGGAVGVGDPDELRKRSTQTVHTGSRSIMYAELKRPGREANGFTLFDASSGRVLADVVTADLLATAAFNYKDVDLAFDLDGGWMYFLKIVNMRGELGGWRLGAP